MSKEIYISSTPHETRLAIVEQDALTEIYYERENEYTLAGSIYNGKVTRVLPGMQSSFVDIGLDRDAFLYITDFMEEAGDAADFEQNANGADHRRGGRAENGDSRRRDDRGGRNGGGPRQIEAEPGGREPNGREPSDGELFQQAVAGVEPSQPQGERGSRRGGRGRRDRNVNSDGTPRRDRGDGRGAERQERPISGNRVESPAPILGEPVPVESLDEVGEAAPGADGSRRWRGRRGRRGSRQDRGGNGAPAEAGNDTFAEPGSQVDAVDIERAEFDGGRREDSGARRERGRDDRGNRMRAPRGFAPSTSLYKVDGASEPAAGAMSLAAAGDQTGETAAVEPLILPGESLSRYRAGGDERNETAGAAATAAPAPASEFVAQGWDGGMVLPGETIRPRGPRPGEDAGAGPHSEFRGRNDRDGRGDRGGRERGGRDDRRGGRDRREGSRGDSYGRRDVRTEARQEPPRRDAAAPAERHEKPASAIEAAQEPVNSTFVPPPPMPAAPALPVAEQEYEPTEASASYRVDPVARSEFRQSAAYPEPPVVGEPVDAAPEHEVTSISATGLMRSEPDELTTQELTAAAPSAQGAPHSEAGVPAEIAAADQALPYFAPGTGVLEEEMLEDEEYAPPTQVSPLPRVHGRAEHDGHEEETLEGAADLGTMIREMSIDQITRSEASVHDEDDDLEEDFLEEAYLGDEPAGDGHEFDGEEHGEPEELTREAAGQVEEPEHGNGFDEERRDSSSVAVADTVTREPRREYDRGRRDGRGGRDRSRDRGRRDNGRGRSMQSTNLPAISELLKPGQEILVQIAKEPIAKKGARITSHIALPGRFLVFMPTVQHTGVSRKIESDTERRRLKEILLSEKGEAAGGFIVRTAAAGASEEELRSDLRFLLNLWTDIKARSEASKSPALIYHDLNLVERVLRDQVTDNFSAIWVDTESEYERVLRFLQRFQPSLIRRVKLYTKETPLFEQFGIAEEINKALRSKVWLKSGGSIVINQTEALVAIDINTGKFVGKTARLEDTIVKTNLDAIPEIVRQIRLRDLGGIIIIDFIDMDERKNRNRVMAALEEELKTDRAPSKVLQFNDFGLVAITRKRVKQSLERTLSTTCGVCQGTGMTKSPVTVCNDIYIELRKMHRHLDRGDIMLRVHPEVVKQLKATPSRWLQEMEEMAGKTILVKSDPSLHPEQFDIH